LDSEPATPGPAGLIAKQTAGDSPASFVVIDASAHRTVWSLA
jgi:hypothetical protein